MEFPSRKVINEAISIGHGLFSLNAEGAISYGFNVDETEDKICYGEFLWSSCSENGVDWILDLKTDIVRPAVKNCEIGVSNVSKKITVGYVIQDYDVNGKCINSIFVAGDHVDWEDSEGNTIDPIDHTYYPFEMVSPEDPFNKLRPSEKWLNYKEYTGLWACRHCGTLTDKPYRAPPLSGTTVNCSHCDGILTQRTDRGQSDPFNWVLTRG